MKVRIAFRPAQPVRRRWSGVLRRDAETLGFDTIWLSDVPLGPIGDPLITLTYVAARTSRLKLGANIVPIGRNPSSSPDSSRATRSVSDGRLLLSFVPGLDQPGERRGARLPERRSRGG
jgi:alkanesulfonate monooxygenase SsuD/methylene tetrahydromethanopterin reductase-like flavin-dependent oxidoreductase (luciferase family)